MRKITERQRQLLQIIAETGYSYCPRSDLDPRAVSDLHELVKARCLTVETNDGAPPRYHLTAQGRADAS